MSDRILNTLHALRAHAIQKGITASMFYREEQSSLMRFANSAISLNTNEHLIRLEISAYEGRKRASYEMITSLDKLDEMKRGVETAGEMVKHAMPLNYDPTVPHFEEDFYDDSGYDAALAGMSNQARLDFINSTCEGLETSDLKLGGIFSSGTNVIAHISTASDKCLFFKFTDAQVNSVLSHERLKWEIIAEQSASRFTDLDANPIKEHLAFQVDTYSREPASQLPIGKYDIVFGEAAIADMLNFTHYIGFNGGLMKRGYSFLSPEQVGKKVISSLVTLADDPSDYRTYPYRRDLLGMKRERYPLFTAGVFNGFTYYQDDADEFGEKPTGHTVLHDSLVLNGGTNPAGNILELANQKRDKDLLYFPYLHYMNIVNPSKGVITGSSRFGALLLKKDGGIVVPYNVRITLSLLEIFGDQVAWIAKDTVPYNISLSYGPRNPQAIVVPKFMRVNDLAISHSNDSY